MMSDDVMAPWLQLTLAARQHSPDQLEDALLLAGAIAVTLRDAEDQPVLEPPPGETPLWRHTRVTGLFDAQTDIEVIKQLLRHALHSEKLPECCLEQVEARDWTRAWLDDFHPMRFGRRLWVCPSHQAPPEPGAVTVRLDPGLAFGTGTHPTTALCLEWLDNATLNDKVIIDYGCGSGILAIAAAKLGARRVWAVDIDPQALLACDDNIADNGVADLVMVSEPAELSAHKADVLLANILAGVLIGLAPRFAELIKSGGAVVLSGVLAYQAGEVEAAFSPWFKFGARRRREDWVLLQGHRNSD